MQLTIVIPVFNEAESIRLLYPTLRQVLDDSGRSYEIIAIDDGSRDDSFAILKALSGQDPSLKVIRFRRNFGQTAAFAAGFDHAQGEVVITMDADLKNDPADIPVLLAELEKGYDVVSGWRQQRKEPFLSRRLPSMLANGLISQVTGVHLHDYGCSLKAYRHEVVQGLHLYGELHRFLPALASSMGASIAEIPVHDRPRRFGRTHYGIARTTRVMLDLLTVRFMLSYSTRPMQLFGSLGLLASALGFALGAFLIFARVALRWSFRPLHWLLLAVLLVLAGLQFIGMGLLEEVTARTYYEAQGKPIYMVREMLSTKDERSDPSAFTPLAKE
jgi:glycosyltransferase involved in cell wall biosynthesis